MKETAFSSKQLTELYDYIAEMGPEADSHIINVMIKNIKNVTIEADDDLITQSAIEKVFLEAQVLSSSQIKRLNKILPWSTFVSFCGSLQGAKWDDKKRPNVHRIPDPHIEKLEKWIAGKRVFEIGCHEGVYTLGLAKFAKSVIALDGRMENVIKTLTRVWLANKLNSVNIVCCDLEELNIPSFYKADKTGYVFDLVHHNGVLYHLSNPLAHLDNILDNNPTRALFLDTHTAQDSQCEDTYEHNENTYSVFRYKEPKARTYSPFAGITPQAIWLRNEDLVEYLRDKGFNNFEETSIRDERNGQRCRILCSRT